MNLVKSCFTKGFLILALFFLTLMLGPFYYLIFGEYHVGDEEDKFRAFIERTPVGLAPRPAELNDAIVQVYSARAWGYKGAFSVHTWIATKAKDDKEFAVYQIKGWLFTKEKKPPLTVENIHPDLTWMSNQPTLLLDIRGEKAKNIIKRVNDLSEEYPYNNYYRVWPGPNSNTFLAYIGDKIPELGLDLPSTAIGKDYVDELFHFQKFGKKSNFDISIINGLLGVKVGYEVGVEIYFMTLNIQLDFDDFLIDYAGIGRQ